MGDQGHPSFLDQHPVLVNYICGSSAACVAETITFPFDLLKTRSQIEGELYSKAYTTSTKKSILRRGLIIIQQEGFFALYNGLSPALWRHLTYSGLRISIYKELKGRIFKPDADGTYPMWKTCSVGFVGGGVSQAIASPFDLVRVQMQMDGIRKLQGKPPRVKGTFHGLSTIYKAGGLKALWKGWMPNAQKSALVNLADLGVYDSSKHFLLNALGDEHMFAIQSGASFTSGLAAAIIGTPADTIKARLMNQPIDNRGRGVYYKGSIDCVVKTIQNEGILAVYKGFFSYWMKLFPFTIIFWNVLELNRKIAGLEGF